MGTFHDDAAMPNDRGDVVVQVKRRRVYSSAEVFDVVAPIAHESHVASVYVLVPYARWPRKRRIEILYYPGPGFDSADRARMDSIKEMFPDADVFLYRTMFDHTEGLADGPTTGYTDHRFRQRSVFTDPEL